MEKTQKLHLDFTESGAREEYLSAFCGDSASNVVEIEVTPALKKGEFLICTFTKDNKTVDTAAVTDGRLVIPFSVLKEQGRYTVSFTVVSSNSKLTAAAKLDINILEDATALVPQDGVSENTSFATLVVLASKQAAETAIKGVSTVSGKDFLSAYGAMCYMPSSSYVRTGNTVIASIGFYSEGSSEVIVGSLPFTIGSEIIACPVCHGSLTVNGTTVTGDGELDVCRGVKGEKRLTIKRKSTAPAILCATVVYFTDDPFPEEA